MVIGWLAASAGAAPFPAEPEPGLVVAAKVDRGAEPTGPWVEGAVGVGADARIGAHGAAGARIWVPAGVVADAAGVRAGLGQPVLEARAARTTGSVRPQVAMDLGLPVGDADVVDAAWGVGAWGGLRIGLGGPSVAWLQAGGETSPAMRRVSLSVPDPVTFARGAHGAPQGLATAAGLPAPPTPTATLAPHPWFYAEVRGLLGFDEPEATGAAWVSTGVGPDGPDVSVGICGATAGGKALRASAALGVPVVTSRDAGLAAQIGVEWRFARVARAGQ